MLPSRASDLLDGGSYTPMNLWRYPREAMADAAVADQLEAIASELVRCVPLLPSVLTPDVALALIERDGEDAWCERRWIEDYRAWIAAACGRAR